MSSYTLVDPRELKARLGSGLERYRQRTKRLIGPLNDDVHRQYDPVMSPLVWDVGHVGNFEELWLLRQVGGRAAHDPRYDDIYNPFDNPRWTRGDLPILSRSEALEYLDEVRGDVLALLGQTDLDPTAPLLRDGYVFEIVIQHEAQHQETMLQALDLREDLSPYESAQLGLVGLARQVDDTERVTIPGGAFSMGTDDTSIAYDNERPRHRVELPTFAIDRFPATNRRYQGFIDAGGYENRDYWSDEGWDYRSQLDGSWPQGWLPQLGGGWLVRRLGHITEVDPREPVQHVSFHEAEAFARFEGGRLPTEEEWEKAAVWGPEATEPRLHPWGSETPEPGRANLDWRRWGPAPVGSFPQGASAYGVEQLLGDVYEWTSSRFAAYPGFSSFPQPRVLEGVFRRSRVPGTPGSVVGNIVRRGSKHIPKLGLSGASSDIRRHQVGLGRLICVVWPPTSQRAR